MCLPLRSLAVSRLQLQGSRVQFDPHLQSPFWHPAAISNSSGRLQINPSNVIHLRRGVLRQTIASVIKCQREIMFLVLGTDSLQERFILQHQCIETNWERLLLVLFHYPLHSRCRTCSQTRVRSFLHGKTFFSVSSASPRRQKTQRSANKTTSSALPMQSSESIDANVSHLWGRPKQGNPPSPSHDQTALK